MAITQAEAIAAVRESLDEPTSIYWTDTAIRRWINDIAKDIARRTEALRAVYNETAVAGTSSYTLAFTSVQQPYRIYRVEYIPTGQTDIYPLEYRDKSTADEVWGLAQQQTQGIPAIWTSWGYPPSLTLQVFPSPAAAGTLRIFYYALPEQLEISTNSDANTNITIVDGWEDILVMGVEARAKRRDGDSSWSEAKNEYEQAIAAMMESTLKFTDANGVIVTANGNYMPEWLYGGDGFA